MTISAVTLPQQYLGTGLNTALSTVFPFFVASDLIVTQRVVATGADVTMVLGTHYTVTGGSGVGAVGTVTPIVGATDFTTGMIWTIDRSLPLTQLLDYVENDSFPAETHEEGLDRLVMQAQDRRAELDRTLRFPVGDVTSLTSEIPDSATRASKALTFDSSGNVVVTTPDDASGTTVLATGTTTSRTLEERFSNSLNVLDFGAKGDGVTDDREAIAAGCLEAKTDGKELYFPPGNYFVDSTGGFIPCDGITMRGSVHTDGSNAGGPGTGSNIFIRGSAGNVAFAFHSGSAVIGMNFWYTNQPDAASPVVFGATFGGLLGVGALNFVRFIDCVFFNSYIAIDLNVSISVGSIFIDRCVIYGISICILFNGNDSTVKITNCSFKSAHFTDGTDVGGLKGWTRLNGSAIKFEAASDGIFIETCQFFGYFKSLDYDTGFSTAQHINNCEFGQALNAIYVNSTASVVQSTVSMCVFFCRNENDFTDIGYALNIDNPSAGCNIKVIGCTFATSTGGFIKLVDPTFTSVLTVVGNNFRAFAHAQASGSYGAVEINSNNARLFFYSNEVLGQANAFASGILITSATIIEAKGNHFHSCNEAVEVVQSSNLILVGNTSFQTFSSISDDIQTVGQDHVQIGNRWDKSAVYTVASATDIELPSIEILKISGTTTVNRIFSESGSVPISGTKLTIIFTGAVPMNDQTTSSGNIFLAGAVDKTWAADDTVTLVSDGSNLYETSRSVN